MLCAEDLQRWQRDGIVVLRRAVDADVVAGLDRRMWTHLEARGHQRDDPSTWPTGPVHHLQRISRGRGLGPASPAVRSVLDQLLGESWAAPAKGGQLLVTFPDASRPWTLPTGLWHTDASFADPLAPPAGAIVLVCVNRVAEHGGGTLLVAGSHRIVARFATGRPNIATEKMAHVRSALLRSEPWLTELTRAHGDAAERELRVRTVADLDGLPARVFELTGEPGDVVVAHPLTLHCIAPNAAPTPRFMVISRVRVRQRSVA